VLAHPASLWQAGGADFRGMIDPLQADTSMSFGVLLRLAPEPSSPQALLFWNLPVSS
jgi:hypothetical protein